jgi:hypothetical protein
VRSASIGALAFMLALLVAAALRLAPSAPATALVAFDPAAFAETPLDVATALGGPLTADDAARVRQQTRAEVERAFAGLRIRFTDRGRAFWRVVVVPSVVRQGVNGRAIQNAAGASYVLGPLGGAGFLNFTTLSLKAVVYAPDGASRDQIVEAIGRGIGRSAVHELTHLILGARSAHSDRRDSYEFHSADRPAQYYGSLRWVSARPLLEARLGRSD